MSEVNNNGGEQKSAYVKPAFTLMTLPLANLVLNPDNLRFKRGTVVEGIPVVDTYNFNSMEGVIKDEGNIPGIIVVEEILDPTPTEGLSKKELKEREDRKRYLVLAGNRRTGCAQIMVTKTNLYPADLLEKLKNVQCHVYKNLTERQRRDLVNDQRSQKYNRAEVTQYAWKLQMAGLPFSEIAMHLWQQVATYSSSGAQKIAEIEKCANDDDRKKIITKWLKGNIDNLVLSCGKMGPRVRRAQLLADMQIDGVSPVIGKDAEGKDVYLLPEFKPSQGLCSDLRAAMKEDGPNWSPENGGPKFNEVLRVFILKEQGKNPDGTERTKELNVRTQDQLDVALSHAHSAAARTALLFAKGNEIHAFADIDAAAHRIEKLLAVAVQHRNAVTDEKVKALLEIFINGSEDQLMSFLAKHSG